MNKFMLQSVAKALPLGTEHKYGTCSPDLDVPGFLQVVQLLQKLLAKLIHNQLSIASQFLL